MVEAILEFDCINNCCLRCSKNILSTIIGSTVSKHAAVVLKQSQLTKEIHLAVKEDSVENVNSVRLNKIYANALGLSEGKVSLSKIELLPPISEVTLQCIEADYSIAALHKDLIETELLNQVQIVKEKCPLVIFVNNSLIIRFTVSIVKPANSCLLNEYTKVHISTDFAAHQKSLTADESNENDCTLLRITSWHASPPILSVPRLTAQCFCNQRNINTYWAEVSKVVESKDNNFICCVECCKKCLTLPSNLTIMADRTLSHYFALNEIISISFMSSHLKMRKVNLELPNVATFEVPLPDGKKLSVVVGDTGWMAEMHIRDDKVEFVKKRVKSQNLVVSTNRLSNSQSLLYEHMVDRILRSYPFSNKSLCILTSKTRCQGAGKTMLLQHLIQDQRLSNFFVLYHNTTALRGKRFDNVIKELTDLLNECCFSQPAVLLIDNLDSVLPAHSKNEVSSGDEIFGTRLAQKLVNLFSSYKQNHVEIIVSCQSYSTCHPLLVESCEQIFMLPLLSTNEQLLFLQQLLHNELDKVITKKYFDKLSLKSSLSVGEVVKVSNVLKQRGKSESCFTDSQINHSCELFELMKVKPVTDQLKLSDCGGLDYVKKEIEKMLILPFTHPELFSQIPFRLNRGLLLFGPPGVGKTHIVKGIANELEMNFLTIKGPELLNKYIGASEEAVRNLFRKAEELAPTLIFFDEFDSLAPCRGNDTTGVMDRVVNQLLTELDGVSKHEQVFIIAATSRPDTIDPAILRPGRIGKKILCPMPGMSERTEIWDCLLKGTKHDNKINTSVLSAETEYYSGADIKAIIYNAQLLQVKRTITASSNKPCILNQDILLEAISKTKRSVTQSDLRDYLLSYENFLSGKTKVAWKTTQR